MPGNAGQPRRLLTVSALSAAASLNLTDRVGVPARPIAGVGGLNANGPYQALRPGAAAVRLPNFPLGLRWIWSG